MGNDCYCPRQWAGECANLTFHFSYFQDTTIYKQINTTTATNKSVITYLYSHSVSWIEGRPYRNPPPHPTPTPTPQESLSLTWINFNPSMWINTFVITSIITCGMKSLIYYQTSTVVSLKFGNGYVIPLPILLWMLLFIRAGIKVDPH